MHPWQLSGNFNYEICIYIHIYRKHREKNRSLWEFHHKINSFSYNFWKNFKNNKKYPNSCMPLFKAVFKKLKKETQKLKNLKKQQQGHSSRSEAIFEIRIFSCLKNTRRWSLSLVVIRNMNKLKVCSTYLNILFYSYNIPFVFDTWYCFFNI